VSDLFLNWRFGGTFVQWGRSGFRLSRMPNRPAPGEAWVSIYQGRWQFALLLLALVMGVLWVAS
jgi:hypothetical protein